MLIYQDKGLDFYKNCRDSPRAIPKGVQLVALISSAILPSNILLGILYIYVKHNYPLNFIVSFSINGMILLNTITLGSSVSDSTS